MTAVILPIFDRHSGRSSTTAQTRLAVALTLSALAHLWLAAGVAVDAPARISPPGPAMLTARLESPEASLEVRALPQSESTGATKIARQDLREEGGSAADGAPRSSAASPVPAPWFPADAPRPHASGQALALIPDPVYYPARQLDLYPALLQPIRLEYPEHASHHNIGGRVLAMLLIDETGGVNEVSIVESQPPGYFEDAVRDVLSGARFFPARKDGRAVKSRVLISVSYNPGEAEGAIR